MRYPDLPLSHTNRVALAFTLIEVVVVVGIIGLLLGLALAGVQSVRATYQRLGCQNNLRQIGIALHQYQDLSGSLPPGVPHPADRPWDLRYGPDTDPYPLLNWHARLLPFIEQNSLWLSTEQAYAQGTRSRLGCVCSLSKPAVFSKREFVGMKKRLIVITQTLFIFEKAREIVSDHLLSKP